MERFEFDPEKSHTNKIKHGIDFMEAQALWTDSDGIEVPALTRDEPRFGRIACLAESCGQRFIPIVATGYDCFRCAVLG